MVLITKETRDTRTTKERTAWSAAYFDETTSTRPRGTSEDGDLIVDINASGGGAAPYVCVWTVAKRHVAP